MRTIKISIFITAFSMFLAGCGQQEPQQQSVSLDTIQNQADQGAFGEDGYWARENFDLQRVGPLLERAGSPQEFESYLNSDDGFSNLDLNGDGYIDYISVDEFDDRGNDQRGLSLYTRFGPDIIQELASIIFYRDEPNWPGARVLLAGNEQIYGDNYVYETNWSDRSLGLVSTLFSDRNDRYRSPYYYENYPANYQAYEVVDPQIYRRLAKQTVPQQIFVAASAPIVSQIKIRSPHSGKWMDKIHAKLAKPTEEQSEYIKNLPERPKRVKGEERGNGRRAGRDNEKQPRPDQAEMPDQARPKAQENPGRGKGKGKGKDDNPGRGQGRGRDGKP